MELAEVITVIGVSLITALSGIAVAMINRGNKRQKKNEEERKQYEKKQDARASQRAKESKQSMNLMSATNRLAIATAVAVKEQRFNGQMEEAMEVAREAQSNYYCFINSVAAEQLTE